MASRTGFLDMPRRGSPKRPVEERIVDWREVERNTDVETLQAQAGRCMDCGVAFCHQGCPLGNHIPEWNDLVRTGRREEAFRRLEATNNFPEVTGRVCPAPCEAACVLGIGDEAVTIRQIERQLAVDAFAEGWITPRPAAHHSGRKVAIVGSGPAGLAAAQQLLRAGHGVTIFERDDKLGGLLRYGIPDFKFDRSVLDQRLAQLRAEGLEEVTGVSVGRDLSAAGLREDFDAICLAIGAQRPRELGVPGAELDGVHMAMDFLRGQNRAVAGMIPKAPIDAAGKRVVVLGGGDTGADCLGTALRQGAASVHHFHYKPPPVELGIENLWPHFPMTLMESSSHEEGGQVATSLLTRRLHGDDQGRVTAIETVGVTWRRGDDGKLIMTERADSGQTWPVDLVLVAIGYGGAELDEGLGALGVTLNRRGCIVADATFRTAVPGVFACGDATRGASLVVSAIWEGRQAAHSIDAYLLGRSRLPTLPAGMPI